MRTFNPSVCCALILLAPLVARAEPAGSASLESLAKPDLTFTWSCEYELLADLVEGGGLGGYRDVAIAPEEVRTATFELVEQYAGSDHHISVRPGEVDELFSKHSFGRGMDFWSLSNEPDMVVFHDEKAVQRSTVFPPFDLRPKEINSPSVVLQTELSPDPEVWAAGIIGVPVPEGSTFTTESRNTRGEGGRHVESWYGSFDSLLQGNKPIVVGRKIHFASRSDRTPLRVERYFKDQLRTSTDLEWERDQLSSLIVTTYSVRENGLPVTRTRYGLTSAEPTPARLVQTGLTPDIPDGYQLLDIDAIATRQSAGPEPEGGHLTLIAILATATTFVVGFLIFRRLKA